MKGCRPLTSQEIIDTLNTLETTRNKSLFLLGISTGLRISELLSIKVSAIAHNGIPLDTVSVSRANTKGKVEGKNIPLNGQAKEMVQKLIQEEKLQSSDYLFTSKKGGQLCRKQAWSILKTAFNKANVLSRTGCHSTRKTFCRNIYLASGKDILITQNAMGHRSVDSTIKYLDVNSEQTASLITSIDIFKAS